ELWAPEDRCYHGERSGVGRIEVPRWNDSFVQTEALLGQSRRSDGARDCRPYGLILADVPKEQIFGCTSKPVKSLCSNLAPIVTLNRRLRRLISSCRNELN